MLVLAVFITSIPLATWSAIALTIEPEQVDSDSTIAPLASESDITVDYPTSVDDYVYIESKVNNNYLNDTQVAECDDMVRIGVFDPVCYLQLNGDLRSVYSTTNGNQVTYYTYGLYSHYLNFGINEGRCASPFFCIRCYRDEHSDLIEACPTYMDAWNHFKGRLDEKDTHTLSPVVNPQYYRYSDTVLSDYTTRELLAHMCAGRAVFSGNDLRRTSDRFDNLAYFYNNSSLFHTENGAQKCYRKYMLEITYEDDTISSGCKLHHGKNYYGLAELDESFSGTLTNIGVNKNLAINSDGTAPQAVVPGNTKNELWLFTKQSDGTYTIEIAPSSSNLTYENTTETRKYLVANHDDNSVRISDTPMNWSIYEVDGLYMLRAQAHDRFVLNIKDDGEVHISIFNNNTTTESTAYNENTLNQMFVINTTYDTLADSDGLGTDFYADIDAFQYSGWDTKVALTTGDTYLRTRQLAQGGFSAADQVWHFIKQSDGTYRIINTANSQYLDSSHTDEPVGSGSMYAMNTKDYKNSDDQKWIVRKRDDGGYFIMPVANISDFYGGSYLSVYTGHQVADCLLYFDCFTGEEASVFDINTTSQHPYVYDLSGSNDYTRTVSFYAYISSGKSEYKDWYLDNGATAYGVEKTFKNCADTDIKKHDYYWNFLRSGDGSYTIHSTTTIDAVLGCDNNIIGINEFIVNVDSFQKNSWYLFKYSGGYRLQFKETGQFLCMDENGTLSLTPLNTNNYDDFQLFNITETDMTIDTVAETFKVNLFNYGSRINDDGILDFFNGEDNSLDKRNLAISQTTYGVIPEMSRVLKDNYPYVNNYAYTKNEANDGSGNNYPIPVEANLKPNYHTSGSLKYLFNTEDGFEGGNNDFQLDHYDPFAENGDEYVSQSFRVVNPSGLFQKDSEGYYYYDSSKNAAYFDVDESVGADQNGTLTGSFKIYDYTVHPIRPEPFTHPDCQGLFAPFNLPHSSGELNYNGDAIYYDNDSLCNKANYRLSELRRAVTKNDDGTINYIVTDGDRANTPDFWFGMTLETDFYQTKDGKLDGEDVKFEFSGDDDVWVYLDGILALDIGDIHGKISGNINFAESTVTGPVKTEYIYTDGTKVEYSDGTYGKSWHRIDEEYAVQTVSLYSLYYMAYEEVIDTDQKTEVKETIMRSFEFDGDELPVPVSVEADPKLRDFEEHTLKLYYLERGAGSSNCMIRLNTLSGGTTVSKKVSNLNKDITATKEYKFKIVAVDENGNESPYAHCPYILSSTSSRSVDALATTDYKTDENGCFTLKANQKATFGKIAPGSNFKIYELTEDSSVTASWKTNVYDSATSTEVVTNGTGKVTDVLKVPTDSTIDVVFTNDYEPSQNITITKAFDETDTSDNYKPDTNQIYVIGYQLLNKEDKVVVTDTVTLHNGESAHVLDIPVGYKYRVWEYTPDGTLNFEAPQFAVNNGSFATKTFVPEGSTPGINSYIEGIAKVNSDDEIVVKNKLIKLGNITVTFKYYDRKRTTDGAPAQINDYYSTFTKELTAEEWEPYLNGVTQRINFSKLIADQGIVFDEEIAVDNIIDDYVIWTSQAEATGENGLKKQKNFFAGKKDDGTYYTYGDVYSENPDMLNYHTNAFGEICDCGEKWVTYYKGSNVIDPESLGNDTEVTAINVWLFNRPKQYELKLNTLSEDELASATQNGDLLIGNNTVTFNAFYNQRVASDSTEDDAFNSQVFWDTYKITDNDIVTGKDIYGNNVDYIDMPETIVNDDDENTPYRFLYWSYDELGETIASTSISYAYRVTNNLELYAVYGKEEDETPGLTAYKNSVDTYIDANGNRKIRLNTMMNPYYCPDNDKTITDAAIVYVMLYGSDKYKNYSEAELLKVLSETSSDGVTTNLDKLREGIKTIIAANKTSGKVTVVDVTVSASGFRYAVESSEGTTSKPNLTVKNRVQFTTEFSASTLKGKRMLAFIAMKKSDEWIVSDNFIDYDFLNNNIF